MIDFDPNAKSKKSGERLWATYRKWRSPEFKIHNAKGHAKAALGWSRFDMAVYHRPSEGSEWVKVGELPGIYSYDRSDSNWRVVSAQRENELKGKMDALA